MATLKDIIRKRRMQSTPQESGDIRAFIVEYIDHITEDFFTSVKEELSKESADKLREIVKKIKKGDKGDKGEPGSNFRGSQGPRGLQGIPGRPGKDGHTPTVKELIALLKPFLRKGDKGEPGRDGSEITDKQIILKINGVENAINISSIKGLETTIKNLQRAIREKTKSSGGGKKHGGGMTLEAGNNITLVRQSNGVWIVSSTASGSAISTAQVTAVQSGSNVTIDLTQLAFTSTGVLVVARNGQMLMPNGSAALPGSSWSQVGTVVTVYNADVSDIYLIQYTHA